MRYLQSNPAVPIKKLAAWLGRTEAAVRHKRHELGIGQGRRWSEADTEFLREHPHMPVKEVAKRLGKKVNSVHNKRNAMGIRSHEWTEDEDRIVRMWHNRLPPEEIAAKLPGRTAMAVSTRARQMGLRSDVFWKPGDIEFLKANPGMSAAEAARTLGKTIYAVQHKRRDLGMARKTTKKKWTDGDKVLLRQLTEAGETAQAIADRMGRTKAAVDVMRRKMGLGTPRSERSLQPDEEKFLRENPSMPAVEIAKHINRTPAAVRRWRNKINLPRYQRHARWTGDEVKLLRANLHLPLSEIYALFSDRSPASVSQKAESLGRARLRRRGHTYRDGYKYISLPDGGKMEEHRRVAEGKIGRPLRRKEVVHHINHIRHDNRPENLDVLDNNSVHASISGSVYGLARGLLEEGAIGYDQDIHSYFLPSRSFDPAGSRGSSTPLGRSPAVSYVFCGSQTFPFPLQPDRRLEATIGSMPHAMSMLPLEGRHAVALFGSAASPARLLDAHGAGASPFPVVKGSLADHSVAPAGKVAGSGTGLVRDAPRASAGKVAIVWVALLDSRQLGAMDACAGRGSLCDLVEVPSPVEFENGEGLYVAHAYVPRGGPRPVYGSSVLEGQPPRLSQVLRPLVRARAQRRAA